MGKKLIFIIGGTRSGKSRFALDYANRYFSKKLYLATCKVIDEEMAQRVENHKKMRGPEWLTIEEPVNIVERIGQFWEKGEVILIDCLTLWLSNLLMRGESDKNIIDEIGSLIKTIKNNQTSFILVSNEVGMGIVPADPVSRRFRDLQGMANQKFAEASDILIFMVSGIPMVLKGEL